MTLKDAENDPRFEHFKFMGMIQLGLYIAKCVKFLADNPDDKEVAEFKEAAVLINKSRIGVKL